MKDQKILVFHLKFEKGKIQMEELKKIKNITYSIRKFEAVDYSSIQFEFDLDKNGETIKFQISSCKMKNNYNHIGKVFHSGLKGECPFCCNDIAVCNFLTIFKEKIMYLLWNDPKIRFGLIKHRNYKPELKDHTSLKPFQ